MLLTCITMELPDMQHSPTISVIVPTLNEADNIVELCNRIHRNLTEAGLAYELLIIDDHSTDDTLSRAYTSDAKPWLRTLTKAGKPGKAYSLLEGFDEASAPLLLMIDADLQYPPEAIAPMYELLQSTNADVVVSERHTNDTSVLRKLSSKVFNFIFAQMLFGIRFDTQSGLKLFRKDILKNFELTPSPWSFDLEFLVKSLENHRRILSYPIPFSERQNGLTKVKVLNVAFELAKASVVLRANTSIRSLRSGRRSNMHFVRQSLAAVVVGLSVAISGLNPQTAFADLNQISPIATVQNVVAETVEQAPIAAVDVPVPATVAPALPAVTVPEPTNTGTASILPQSVGAAPMIDVLPVEHVSSNNPLVPVSPVQSAPVAQIITQPVAAATNAVQPVQSQNSRPTSTAQVAVSQQPARQNYMIQTQSALNVSGTSNESPVLMQSASNVRPTDVPAYGPATAIRQSGVYTAIKSMGLPQILVFSLIFTGLASILTIYVLYFKNRTFSVQPIVAKK